MIEVTKSATVPGMESFFFVLIKLRPYPMAAVHIPCIRAVEKPLMTAQPSVRLSTFRISIYVFSKSANPTPNAKDTDKNICLDSRKRKTYKTTGRAFTISSVIGVTVVVTSRISSSNTLSSISFSSDTNKAINIPASKYIMISLEGFRISGTLTSSGINIHINK